MDTNNKKIIAGGAFLALLSIAAVWSINSCQPKVVRTHQSPPIEGPIFPTVSVKPTTVPLLPTSVPASSVDTLPILPSPPNTRCYLLIVTPDQAKLENMKCPKK